MAYQLLRTNVALTGNVKICCYITNKDIERVSLNPLTTSEAIIPHDVNLQNSYYSKDLAQYSQDYKSIFYDNIVNVRLLKSGVFKKIVDEDEFETGYVTDYTYGAKRVSLQKNGKQLSILAPIFINSKEELPKNINIELSDPENGNIIYTSIINISDTVFSEYIKRSYKGIDGASCQSIFIDTTQYSSGIGRSTLRGWSIDSGDLTEISTSNLPQKLFSRDITYTEFDSYIDEEFRTHNIVFPYILNFCWYFNIEDIIETRGTNIKYGDIFTVNAYYTDSRGERLEIKDIDFNHYNIKANGGDNVLNYLHEQDVVELRDSFKEHLAPTINRWSLVGSDNSYIFNTYIGYDMKDTNITYTFNTNIQEPSKSYKNLSWFNYLLSNIPKEQRTSLRPGISKYSEYSGEYENFFNSIAFGREDKYIGIASIIKDKNVINNKFRLHKNSESDEGIFSLICNGIKMNIDSNNLPQNGLIETSGKNYKYRYSNKTSMSISLIDNIYDITKNDEGEEYVDPRICVIIKPDWKNYDRESPEKEIDILEINFVIWIPFSITRESIYDMISDIEGSEQKKNLLKKLVMYNVFKSSSPSSFLSCIYEIQSDNSWELHSKEEGSTEESNIIHFDTISSIIEPTFTRPNKRLYSKRDNMTQNNVYKLFQENHISDIIIGRYYGWIQPHFITVLHKSNINKREYYTTTDNNYIFKRVVWSEDRDIEKEWGDGIQVIDLNTSYTGRGYIPDIYPYKVVEGKWLFASQIVYTPSSITSKIRKEDIDLDKTNSEIKKEILNKIFRAEYTEYMSEQYSSSYDISKDENYYLVNLRLK